MELPTKEQKLLTYVNLLRVVTEDIRENLDSTLFDDETLFVLIDSIIFGIHSLDRVMTQKIMKTKGECNVCF
jgi:hypothetical protein